MSDPLSWLKLMCADGIGSRTAHSLVATFGDAHNALTASRSALEAHGFDSATATALHAAADETPERDIDWLKGDRRYLLAIDDERFPPLLRRIDDPPIALFVAGEPDILAEHQLAIVGSRNPTPQGRENASAFATHLARCGLVITSGLARGIDAAAHRAAVSLDGGASVAVCGTGLDEVYPRANRRLAGDIAKNGAMVSEFRTGTPPSRGNFPRRNRIISGLALGTLVVEAAERSGSLITAHHATEQGREVFAIPGSIHNPLAHGCHRLIREGAKLVESGADILLELGPLANVEPTPRLNRETEANQTVAVDGDYKSLLDALGHDPATVDTLVHRSGLTADAVSSMLLILELQGIVRSAPGGFFDRISRGSDE